MNYLKICQKVINSNENKYIGYITPKAYCQWNKLDPLILILEGIHQFAVRAVRLIVNSCEQERYIPIQIMDLEIIGALDYNDLHIVGCVNAQDSFFKVQFLINSKVNKIKGIIYVSKLKG